MLLLGSVPRARVPRHLFCGDAYCVTPAPPKSHPCGTWKSGGVSDVMAEASAKAVSALARALHRTDSVAVVRVSSKARADGHPSLADGQAASLRFLPCCALQSTPLAPGPLPQHGGASKVWVGALCPTLADRAAGTGDHFTLVKIPFRAQRNRPR